MRLTSHVSWNHRVNVLTVMLLDIVIIQKNLSRSSHVLKVYVKRRLICPDMRFVFLSRKNTIFIILGSFAS